MGEPCGSWAKTPGRPCRRQVKVGCAPCWQHRRAALQPIPGPRGPRGPSVHSGSRVPHGSRVSHGSRVTGSPTHHGSDPVVDVTFDVIFGKSWPGATRDKFIELVGEQLISALYRKRPKGGCKPLADLANTLLSAESQVKSVVLDVAGQVFKPLARRTIERKIAEELIRRVPLTVPYELKTIARALQALGICLCIQSR